MSVCPKYVGNVAKTLREVGTYELRAGHRYRRRSARRGPARTRFFTRAARVKYRDRVGLWSAKTVWESAPCFERDAFSGASV